MLGTLSSNEKVEDVFKILDSAAKVNQGIKIKLNLVKVSTVSRV